MKTITKQELVTLINGTSGVTFLSLDMKSEPRMRKTDNPYYGKVEKIVTLSGAVGYNYENSVNAQLQREGKEPEFVAQKRAWGEREGHLITHKGSYYIPVKVQGSSEPVFVCEGERIEKSVLEPFLQESSKPHTQDALEKEIVVRDVKMDNIITIRAFGEEYMVV